MPRRICPKQQRRSHVLQDASYVLTEVANAREQLEALVKGYWRGLREPLAFSEIILGVYGKEYIGHRKKISGCAGYLGRYGI